ncbi:MAG: pyruvate ferredoxin oxidoreductase [Chloroflexi bacterium]|nr:pyruvate ferredoxin oxidoreductase [Chloroflexota bacterium]
MLGCRLALDAARLAARAAGGDVVVVNATGCLEVISSSYPYSSWNVPWLHSLFENAPAVASGVEAALRAQGRTEVRVIAEGGDGGTADIGLQCLSGMFERGHDILYICYDNEAYMNTGVQRSSLTPPGARTSTTPIGDRLTGNDRPKKDLPAIAVAHGVAYVATASVGYYRDLQKKVEKAMQCRGPRYLQVHVPCPLGWGHDGRLTIRVAQLAVRTGLYPLFEMEDGRLTGVRKLPKRLPVEEYLKTQGRFRHLFSPTGSPKQAATLAELQAIADRNVERYGL